MITMVCQKMGIDTGDRLETNARKLKFLVKGPIPDDSTFPPFEVCWLAKCAFCCLCDISLRIFGFLFSFFLKIS